MNANATIMITATISPSDPPASMALQPSHALHACSPPPVAPPVLPTLAAVRMRRADRDRSSPHSVNLELDRSVNG